jgi:hypothetical protein
MRFAIPTKTISIIAAFPTSAAYCERVFSKKNLVKKGSLGSVV